MRLVGSLHILLALALGSGVATAVLLTACGGSTNKPARAPESHSGSGSSESEESSSGSDESAPPAPDCSDGTCFTCGSGVCPTGFYCDQGSAGGSACSWLPECASKNSCACIQQSLGSGCSCDSKGGGLYVSCK